MKRIFIIFISTFTLGIVTMIASDYLINRPVDSMLKESRLTDPNENWSITQFNGEYPAYQISKELLKSTGLPTNKWFSGFLKPSLETPIYPYPHALSVAQSKLGYSLPKKVSNEKVTFQSYVEDVNLTFGREFTNELFYYDDILVKYNLLDTSKTKFAEVTIIRGNPLIKIKLINGDLTITGFEMITTETDNNLVFQTNGNQFYLNSFRLNEFVKIGNLIKFNSNNQSSTITFGYIPDTNQLELYTNFAQTEISSVKTKLSTVGKMTNLKYTIESNNPNGIFFGLLPHHYLNQAPTEELFQINTLRGDMKFYKSDTFSFEFQNAEIPEQFNFEEILNTPEKLAQVESNLKIDRKTLSIRENSMYFIGKELFRLSNMLDIAKFLDTKLGGNRSNEIETVITNELSDWFKYTVGEKNRYLSYDLIRKGLIAEKPDFGSENYNDHHFHYAYIIYAYSTISKYNRVFEEKYSDVINLMINDIANYTENTEFFPRYRYFDFYEWHSWANGTDNFADGNNQESISEALNAWYAIYKLGINSGSETYTNLGLSLYMLEKTAGELYWYNSRSDLNILGEGYKMPVASLVWQGKAEFSTFFSADPNAMLAILMLPISPASSFLENEEISNRIYSFKQDTNGSLFKDILNLYYIINKLPYDNNLESWELDSSNSYSYNKVIEFKYK